MFGYVTPCKMELKVKDYEKFKAYYCGLCLAIKETFGNIPRFTLNYDMTFLAILLDGLNEDKIHYKKSICIAHPLKKKIKIINNNALKYAAFCNISLTYFKLLDNYNDNNSKISKVLSSFLKKYIKTSEKEKIEIMDYMERKLDLLSKMENSNDSINIDEISDIFADLTGYIISEYYKEDDNTNLYWLGYNLGRFIYLIDAYDDLKEDMEHNKFNAIEKAFNKNKLPFEEFIDTIRERIELNLILSAESCVTSLKNLPLKKNKELLTNILQLGLMEKIESIKIKECKKHEKSI
ncbi:MAG: hypothetical protein KID00_03320 [Clostridium argentinense]|uniref:DUF5685 family protein n=1 Tax=uncultured Clostridium sp. TaxID=59620 RepID=UPI001DC69557|nr:DUF5685 family protein [uncultured Clostridium sp.]MBS5822884.1 hypothetical protein [Clostridium argentinense]MDU1349103.1 DUF5685 family protein [Clostridium argentinense]